MTSDSVSGLSGGLYLGSDKVAEGKNMTLTINRATQDASNVDGGGFEECNAGLANWQISGDFNLIVGDTTGFLALQTAILAGVSVTVKARSTLTGYNWSGDAYPTQAQLGLMDLRNSQSCKWTLKGTGVLTPAAS